MSQHKTWVLDSLSELRVEVPYGARFSLKLLSGAAEIFGAEITNHMIDVSGDNIAVFTYTGCTLEGSGTWTNDYIPSETPPPLHLNIHACLQVSKTSIVECRVCYELATLALWPGLKKC
eukprot:c19085_g2_i4.p1 GENE.c19085_g2_i4~~c19085_g2_i4.p1  ORF type:complete len:119 (+),score=14.19 c19085_g2_i4:10-366(+)